MRSMVHAFATRDVSNVDALIAETYLDHQGLGGGAMHGPTGFRQVVTAARRAVPNLDVTIEDLIAEGDRVAARLRWRGTQAANGATVDRETIDIVRFAQGQAVEHWGIQLWSALS
jgi:predicted ester cyclase